MSEKAPLQRVTFSPGEFAALFGKSKTWGYRQVYAGKVQAITEYGRMLIPAAEVERILETAGRYEGMKKPAKPKPKAEIQKLKPQLQSAWQKFFERKRGKTGNPAPPRTPGAKIVVKNSGGRNEAITRLTGGKKRPLRA